MNCCKATRVQGGNVCAAPPSADGGAPSHDPQENVSFDMEGNVAELNRQMLEGIKYSDPSLNYGVQNDIITMAACCCCYRS